jgi:alpha-L-rhamnosidase
LVDTLTTGFLTPPTGYGPTPFWWWSGGDLDIHVLTSQLDRLREKGVMSAVIGYSHLPDGTIDQGQPEIWSDAWFDILCHVLDHARDTNMTLGMQDYILLNPALARVGPTGRSLHHLGGMATPHSPLVLQMPETATIVEAMASNAISVLDLTPYVHGTSINWRPHDGSWNVDIAYTMPTPFDALSPGAGARSLSVFQERFAARVGDHLGTTLTIFFQDELDFHSRWPIWSDDLIAAFETAKGYDLRGHLVELWVDRGAASVKFRLDFHDVAVTMLEERFFQPVKDWHDRHNCLYGHDNAGRGAVGRGRDFYGDYMRTMRWYSAPGSDDPDLNGPRAFVGIRVASSIATLYDRPRVWAECFHSSGWGATPAQMVAATNGVFVLGANLINLHALYATTAGSWWEWAPPDFHFRQPYWRCISEYNHYVTRVCWLMSQGDKIGDAVMLYPTTAIAGGLNAKVDPHSAGPVPYSEQQRGESLPDLDVAEICALSSAQALFDAGVDLDFIDDASLEATTLGDGIVAAGRGRWRTVILPEMTAIRWATLERLDAFVMAGGRVVFLGALPRASDLKSQGDPDFDNLIARISGEHSDDWHGDIAEQLFPLAERGFVGSGLQALHRSIGDTHIWLIVNPNEDEFDGPVTVAAKGQATLLDPFHGLEVPCSHETIDGNRTRLSLHIPPKAMLIVRIKPGPVIFVAPTVAPIEVATLQGPWEYELVPTLDNRQNDFDSTSQLVGLEVHRMEWCEGDDAAWHGIAPGFAPRLLVIGPFALHDGLDAWAADIALLPPHRSPLPRVCESKTYEWRPYFVSARDGIFDDPWLKNWASGPHGLKNSVPDEYIDLGDATPGEEWLLTGVLSGEGSQLTVSSRAAFRLWIDGCLVAERASALPPGEHGPWNLPTYDAPTMTVPLPNGGTGRFVLRLTQPEGQRARAYVGLAVAPAPSSRSQRFLTDPRFRLVPQEAMPARPQRYRFSAPPGIMRATVRHRGRLSAWRSGNKLTVSSDELEPGWAFTTIEGGNIADPDGSIEIRLDDTGGERAGDAIGVVRFDHLHGFIPTGDWCLHGLGPYSGGVRYSADCQFEAADTDLVLDVGPVGVCAEVAVNETILGHVLCPPWRIPLGDTPRAGTNRVSITVFNTLANHYAEVAPTPFVFPGQTRSGLFSSPKLLRQTV